MLREELDPVSICQISTLEKIIFFIYLKNTLIKNKSKKWKINQNIKMALTLCIWHARKKITTRTLVW
jgi:hypothetical protein